MTQNAWYHSEIGSKILRDLTLDLPRGLVVGTSTWVPFT